MIERGMLFSGPMVRALLAGQKTQTRRLVNPQPDTSDGWVRWGSKRYDNGDGVHQFHTDDASARRLMVPACPYGVPGDRLWVRESWNVSGLAFGMRPSEAAKVASPKAWRYAATDRSWKHGWKPSIHMPRRASRITLELTVIRVERLQEISEEDARAEGIASVRPSPSASSVFCVGNGESGPYFETARDAYAVLWDAINAERATWKSNPFVWTVEFRELEIARAA